MEFLLKNCITHESAKISTNQRIIIKALPTPLKHCESNFLNSERW